LNVVERADLIVLAPQRPNSSVFVFLRGFGYRLLPTLFICNSFVVWRSRVMAAAILNQAGVESLIRPSAAISAPRR